MHKIKFKKLVIQNFLCFGKEATIIDFDNLNKVILVKGQNLDTISDIDDNTSSNGSGKSSILDAFIYALFGKTVKNPKKIGAKDVINNIIGKKMVLEIYFDDYKIQRTRKPDSLKFWKCPEGKFDDASELTRGEMRQTQALIESVLGFSYDTMKSICVFTDNNSDSYLESSAQERRNIIENLLGLEKYRKFHEKTKEFIKENKSDIQIKNSAKDSIVLLNTSNKLNLQTYQEQKQNWITQIQNDIDKYELEINMHKKHIENIYSNNTELQKYNEAQNEIVNKEDLLSTQKTKLEFHEDLVNKIQEKAVEIVKSIQDLKDGLTPITTEMAVLNNDLKNIDKIQNLSDGVQCQHCFNNVSHKNCSTILSDKLQEKNVIDKIIIDKAQIIEHTKQSIQEKLNDHKQANDVAKTNTLIIKNIKDNILKFEKEIAELRKIQKPETATMVDLINNKITSLKISVIEKQSTLNKKSPYCDLIDQVTKQIEDENTKIKTIELDISDLKNKAELYDFWLEAFSEKGIRKFIIEQILPVLNKTIEEMLDILIDGKLTLIFDSEFSEKISKFPELVEMPYDLLSNGQKRRINLALSQAFAYVRQLNVGNYPSVMFLDEVSINMDSQGNQAIYNLINDISKEKQVFVTTHDSELQQLIYGGNCDNILVQMKDGFSKIV
jgi:exonuclease SbcC